MAESRSDKMLHRAWAIWKHVIECQNASCGVSRPFCNLRDSLISPGLELPIFRQVAYHDLAVLTRLRPDFRPNRQLCGVSPCYRQ